MSLPPEEKKKPKECIGFMDMGGNCGKPLSFWSPEFCTSCEALFYSVIRKELEEEE